MHLESGRLHFQPKNIGVDNVKAAILQFSDIIPLHFINFSLLVFYFRQYQ